MPLATAFSQTAIFLDDAIRIAMTDAVSGGIAAVRPQLVFALELYVIGHALGALYGRTSLGEVGTAVVRAVIVSAVLLLQNYNFYVMNFFFTDAPNYIAASIAGARVNVNAAQQFDILWDGVQHYRAFLLSIAGWDPTRTLYVYFESGVIYFLEWLIFALWYLSRPFMGIAISIGPWLIPLWLFGGTRSFCHRWIGIVVGLTILGLSSTVLLRYLMVIMATLLAALKTDANVDFDIAIGSFESVIGVFFLAAVLMVVMPSVFAIGGGAVGSGAAVVGGMLGSMASGAVGSAVRGGGAIAGVGAAVGQATGAAAAANRPGSRAYRRGP